MNSNSSSSCCNCSSNGYGGDGYERFVAALESMHDSKVVCKMLITAVKCINLAAVKMLCRLLSSNSNSNSNSNSGSSSSR